MQSNHTRQVAAVAAKIGMKCRLVQESWVPFEDAVYDRVGNILMSRVMGAEVELVDEGFDIGIRESWQRALDDVEAKGGKPYPIPAGASVHELGGLGFVGFAEEVRAQEQELGFAFDYIVVCTVTGHGLKDPNRAIAEVQVGDPVEASAAAVASALDLT